MERGTTALKAAEGLVASDAFGVDDALVVIRASMATSHQVSRYLGISR